MGIEVEHVAVDAHSDLRGLILQLCRLIKQEIAKGNRVYVNISAAGRVAAAAAVLASMAHLGGHGQAYYVRPEEYEVSDEDRPRHGLTKGMLEEPTEIPLFPLQLPSREGQIVLLALKEGGGSASYFDLFGFLHRGSVEGYVSVTRQTDRGVKGNLTVRLTKTILRPLVDAGLIRIEKGGRKRVVQLTEAGDYMACIL